jgi:hypothetical protein
MKEITKTAATGKPLGGAETGHRQRDNDGFFTLSIAKMLSLTVADI